MSAELTEADLRLFTEGKNFGHLAALMPDGSPHVTPVWIDARDGLIWVNSAEGRRKVDLIRRDPRVAISVRDPDSPYAGVMVRGSAVEITNEGAAEHIDEMSWTYRNIRPYRYHDPTHPRVLIMIRPDHVARF